MPAKKAARTETSATANAALLEWIKNNDALLATDAKAATISELFQKVITAQKFNRNNTEHTFDWSAFKAAMENRDDNSPRWFVQLRKEDLLCEPDGLEGTSVDCFVVVEATEPTLAPAHFVLKEHWPNSDLEDNAPERVNSLADQKLHWKPITKDDGTSINAFLLSRREAAPVASAAPISFGIAAPVAAAPSTSNLSFGIATASPAAPINFGFGAPTAASPAAPAQSFGFGSTTPAAAAPATGFGFGAPAAKPTQPTQPAAGFSFGGPAATKQIPVTDVVFVLWSKNRVKEMLKELKSGSRIVKESTKIGADGKTMKLIMQNDLKDDVEKTAHDLVLNKIFAKSDAELRKIDTWLDNCPVYDEHLAPHLQKFRAKFLKDQAEESDEFAAMVEKYEANICAELSRMVAERKSLIAAETAVVEGISTLLKEHKIADKSTFRVLKYYPANDILPFRPFGKVSGISESGEHADLCFPPMYVFKNRLLQ
ncbi:nucleoporin-like protein, putative [Bodo saltans]|uniref:Nucleoporin-like protein, putative n=1 Tax=Bodo saltans TaxID=75058 RepID=A0A0S4J4Z2_BODSA|nr:nucleoporin-like protein, putative [Bodo saltans]|eukprot:CUG82566.1 nucleoporin-like protein, putative [Bodo saltans]